MTDEGGVLGNLPNSRPGKRSARRDGPANAARTPGPKPQSQRTTAVREAGPEDGVRLRHDMDAQVGHDRANTPETQGDPLSAAVRTAAGLAIGSVKVAGAVTKELVRRLPKP
jgi:hypothetical protein